MKKKNNVKE